MEGLASMLKAKGGIETVKLEIFRKLLLRYAGILYNLGTFFLTCTRRTDYRKSFAFQNKFVCQISPEAGSFVSREFLGKKTVSRLHETGFHL
jgi:hypothetical protein